MSKSISIQKANRIRLSLIKKEFKLQYGTYDEFREVLFPDIKINTFRAWFKKPYYISDERLKAMEARLSIPEYIIRGNLAKEGITAEMIIALNIDI